MTRAQSIAAAYPGLVQLHRILPDAGVNPLDACLESSRRTGLPTPNPGNMTWIPAVGKVAREIGSTRLVIGSHGNYSFSFNHVYAPSYYTTRGQFARAWWCASQLGAQSVRSHLGRIWSTPRQRISTRFTAPTPMRNFWRYTGMGDNNRFQRAALTRAEFLRSLSPGTGVATASTRTWAIPTVDPFASPKVLDFAASMTPRQWCLGPSHRGFARLAGAGRVPDAIRYQRRRGLQGADQWHLMHTMRDRYYDEIALLPDTPVVSELVDVEVLRSTLESLPWGDPACDELFKVYAVNRVLTLAAFIRMSEDRLARLPRGDNTPEPG